jgi:hypothetical protein
MGGGIMPKEDFNIKESEINTFWKMVEEHNQKYDEQIKKQWIEIAKQAKENVEKKQEFTGKVIEIEDNSRYGYHHIVDNDSLNKLLEELHGKTVKITIEVI